jgi:VCBS repeat-containing protein
VLTYTVTDTDGDPAVPAGIINITVNDDTPTATATAIGTVTAVLDETSTTTTTSTLAAFATPKGDDPDVPNSPNATGYISRAVTGAAVVTAGGGFGADGAAAVNPLTYALTITNAVSGLKVTDGSAINLFLDTNGVIVGKVAAGAFAGQAAFALSINATTGVVTVEQYLSLQHPTGGPSSPDEIVALAAGSLGVIVTRTDGDGDSTASVAADISGQIQFHDDGPTVSNDVDGVTGTTPVATGNVLTGIDFAGGDTNATDGSADAKGADGGAITLIASNNVPANTDSTTDGSGNFQVAGQYGSLVINANGDYTYTRSGNLGGGQSDVFTYTLTDGDGDTKTATLTITIADAVPSAGTINATLDDDALPGGIAGGIGDTSPDSTNLTGTLPSSGGDAPLTFGFSNSGAPAGFTYDTSVANTLLVKQGATTVITVTVNAATGAYTIVQNAAIAHASGGNENNQAFVLTYTVTDTDGDPAVPAGVINITVNDDTPTATATAIGTVTAVLDETSTTTTTSTLAAFATPKGDDPDVPNAPNATGYISRAVTGAAVVTAGGGFGADGAAAVNPLTYALTITNAVSGLKVTDGSAINLFLDTNGVIVGKVAAGSFAGQAAFALSINATTGVVTVEQYLSLQHPTGGPSSPDEIVALAAGSLGVIVTRTDGDGDSTASVAADISGQIQFHDDASTLGTLGSITVPNAVGTTSSLPFNFNAGADGWANFAITGPAITGITYQTVALANGAKLVASSDPDGAGPLPAVTVFELTVLNDGHYIFNLLKPDAGTSTTISLLGLSAGGPTPFLETSDFKVEFTGSGNGVNSSTQGFGVDNQFVGVGESFTIELHKNGIAGDDAPTTDIRYASSITLGNNQINGALTVTWTATNSVTSQTFTGTTAITGSSTTFNPGFDFNLLSVVGTSGSGQGVRFSTLTTTVTVLPHDQSLTFQVIATDGDGDTTAPQSLNVFISTAMPPPPFPPIILDLNHDGVHFLPLAAGVTFDYLGNGSLLHTAWAGKDDGILAIDLNGNGKIDSGKEFVFGGNGLTDLQGLAATYDSNHDGVLDAKDEAFAKFGVWQDANSNGISDAGEFKSLAEAGITSINLTSDGKAYAAAGGDVTVHGETTFTMADGTIGVAADASFAVSGTIGATGDVTASLSSTDDVMASLLSLAASDSPNVGTSSGDSSNVALALGDSHASNFVDNLVDSLAGAASAPLGGGSGANDNDAMSALLATSVGSHENAYVPMPFDMGDEAHVAALAAG